MAALSVNKLPEGPEWAYEVKFDGSPDKSIVMST
jgi:ATP-dependent DNA ligase